MTANHEKGPLLERAVRRIEEVIISQDPSLKGARALIEQNKIVVRDGTKHEIDIWVTVNPNTNYETQHIIECKNWSEPVGKTVVGELITKRGEVGAHTAAIIAPAFTQDAVNLAKRHLIKLSTVSDAMPIKMLTIVSHEVKSGQITFTFRSQPRPATLDFDKTQCSYMNQVSNLTGFYHRALKDCLNKVTETDPRSKVSGQYTGGFEFKRDFDPGMLLVDGHDVAKMELAVKYSAFVGYPTVSAKFSVDGRGGFYEFNLPESVTGVKNMTLEIVTRNVGGMIRGHR